MNPDILLVCAAPLEALDGYFSPPDQSGAGFLRTGELTIGQLVTGIGPVNAAYAMGRALAFLRPGLVLSFGVGGAFRDCGLDIGSVAVAKWEYDLDVGIESETIAPLPLPIPVNEGVFSRYACDPVAAAELMACAPEGVIFGGFVSSATVTSSHLRAAAVYSALGPICENMEGAAVARCAQIAGVPFAEVRGISNFVGARERDKWNLTAAADASRVAVRAFIERERR